MTNPVLVEAVRGGRVESAHRGAAIVVDATGKQVMSFGDGERLIFPRSSVKALQALPLIESGAADALSLTDAELALACASHEGEPEHVATATSMLKKAGIDAHCLACGVHWPTHDKAARALASTGQEPTALHHQCSGKHAGFVCVACSSDDRIEGYESAAHPVQEKVRRALADMTGAPHEATQAAIDGCSIPTYALPLKALALGFARFGTGEGLDAMRAKACARLRKAVAAHPEMVAGPRKFDTKLMQALGARAFVKVGAEGVYSAAIPELGFGIALKCDDGAIRAAEVMMAALIMHLLPLSEAEHHVVAALRTPPIKTWRGAEVGFLRATLPL
jgi:L-asparaginase II